MAQYSVCVCMCVRVCTYVHARIYMYEHTIRVCLSVRLCVYVSVFMYVRRCLGVVYEVSTHACHAVQSYNPQTIGFEVPQCLKHNYTPCFPYLLLVAQCSLITVTHHIQLHTLNVPRLVPQPFNYALWNNFALLCNRTTN